MGTFIIYNFILLWATFFGYLYQKSQSVSRQRLFIFLSFIIPFLFLALRYDIGQDYQNYVAYFHRIASGELILKEPSYLLINKIIAKFGLDVQWLFVIFGFIFMFFAYKSIPKEVFAVGLFIFISTIYLLDGFSLIRQGVAVAMMFYGIRYVIEQKFLKYFILSLIAMSFHTLSGFIFLISYPIIIRQYNRWLLLGILSAIYLIVVKTDIIFNIMSFTVSLFPKYSWYLNSEYMEGEALTSGLGILAKFLLGMTVIFFKDTIINRYKNANPYINLYVLHLIFLILHIKIKVFSRVEFMFVYSQMVIIGYFILSMKKETKVLATIVIGIFFLILFNKYIAAGVRSPHNHIYVNPYQNILFDR